MPLPAEKSRVIRFGLFEVDLREAELRRGGIRLKLQEQPFQILTTLLERPGQTVTREELRQKLWPADTFVDFDHSLNSSINKLREALGDKSATPRFIETLPKRGYRFIGEVAREEAKEQSVSLTAVVDEAKEKVATTLDDAAISASRKSRSVRLRRAVAISGFALLTLAAIVYWAAGTQPMPHVVGSHVLTKTGNPKAFGMRPIVDRGSLYFVEAKPKPSEWFTLQVSTAGGESESLKLNCCLTDISSDGSEALWDVYSEKHKGCDTWVQPLHAGTPRLVIEDACWPMWSADGRSFFFIRNNETELYRANVDGTDVQRLAVVPLIDNPHLSPDGSRIRFTGNSPGLWEAGADGSNPHPIFIFSGDQDVLGGSWSSDGKYYFFTGWDGDRWSLWAVSESHRRWKKTNTSPPQQLTFGPQSIGSPAISKDGKQLYAVGIERQGQLSAYDSKSGKFVPYLGGPSICMVDFSRDGQWIAYVTYPEGTLWRSRIDGSERMQLTVPPLAPINPRWSPDGKLIAFSDGSNGDRGHMTSFGPGRIYAVSAEGGRPMLLLAGHFGDPTWSPDGRSVAYHYFQYPLSEVRILDLQSRKSTVVQGSQGMWSPRWSPDGKHLVALGGEPPRMAEKLMLFSFASNAWVELASASVDLGASGGAFGWPSWSHDSKFVYALGENADPVVRITIADGKKERVASLRGLRATSYFFDRIDGFWLGFTPDDRPLILRDIGIQEIYAFDLEYK